MEPLTGTIANRYTILDRLGAGGMGDVYRATDNKLRRTVAIKRLRPDGSSQERLRERLLHEAQTAAHVTHGGLAALYDVLDDSDDELLLVMEFVEGRTLRDRLSEHVTPAEALDIVARCASALRAAHQHGIVHYDLKPSNIMIQPDGGVKILDFGLAQIVPAVDPEGTTAVFAPHASSGKIAGTPPYMSPEVLLGEDRDHRADLFSLGVVFYEMLTHRNPFMAATPSGISDRVLHLDPAPLRSVDPGIPEQLQPIVSGLIAKQPGMRYATTDALIEDLRLAAGEISHPSLPPVSKKRATGVAPSQWAAGVAAVVLAAMAAGYAMDWFPGPATEPPPATTPPESPVPALSPLVAVLPFGDASADPSLAALNDGMAATLASKLMRLALTHDIRVLSPSALASEEARTVEQARQLGATRCITFHLMPGEDRVRAILSLVDAGSGVQLDTDTVEVAAGDVAALAEEVFDRVLRMLRLSLGPLEHDVLTPGTSSSMALALSETGRGYLHRPKTEDNAAFAIQQFQQALRVDKGYAEAHAGLGIAYHRMYDITGRAEWLDRAEAACRDALQADELGVAGNGCLGVVLRDRGRYEEAVSALQIALERNPADVDTLNELGRAYEDMGRNERAEGLYLEAIERAPDNPVPHKYLGAFYLFQGRNREAIAALERSTDLAPDDFRTYDLLGIGYYQARDWPAAILAWRRAIQLNPTYSTAHSNLASLYLYQRRYQESADLLARAVTFPDVTHITWGNLGEACSHLPGRGDDSAAAFQRAVQLAQHALGVNPNDAIQHGQLAYYLAYLDRREAALEHLARALELDGRSPGSWRKAAQVQTLLGDHDAAIDAIGRALTAGYNAGEIRDDPVFDPLTSDPRYAALVAAKAPNP